MKVAGMEIPGLSFGIFGLIVCVIGYYLGTRTGKAKSTPGNVLANDINEADLTYQLSQYVIYADRCQDAMSGAGTDTEALKAVFVKMRNNSDLLQLITSFGRRGAWWQGGSTSFTEWLSNDCSPADLTELNNILQRNNISFQF